MMPPRSALNVSLTPELMSYIGDHVVSGQYRSADEVLQVALRLHQRQVFLFQLGDRLRALDDPRQTMAAAVAMLGVHLAADRAGYAEVDDSGEHFIVDQDWTAGAMLSFAGRQCMNDLGPPLIEALRQGHTIAFSDALTEPLTQDPATATAFAAASLRAAIIVPLVKEGRFRAALYVHQAVPRAWTEAEEDLVREVGKRTWSAVEHACAEAALRESELRFRSFVENSTDVLWIVGAEARQLEYLSPSFERVWGQPRERIMQDLSHWSDTVHPDDRARVKDSLPRVLAGETCAIEYRIIRPDGAVRWIFDTGFPIPGADGRVQRTGGIAQDITDRKHAEKRLAASQAQFRAVAELVPDLLWRNDASGLTQWCNQRWLDYTGQTLDEMVGYGWLATIHPDDCARSRASFQGAVDAGSPLLQEHRIRAADGRFRWFLVRVEPVRNEAGRVLQWFGSATDIDAQVHAREGLARSAEELEQRVAARTAELMATEAQLRQSQKMEAVGQLTGGIAHDFNNMLQGIAGSLDMLQRRIRQGRADDALMFAGAAYKTVERAAALTHRLLAFARRQTLQPRTVEPDGLIEGMADLIRRTTGPGILVELHLSDGIWTVLCDPNQLENVLLNLAINARDAMPEGGRLTIGIEGVSLSAADVAGQEGAMPGDYVEISVADTGTGMDEVIRARAFEPFFTTKPLGQGTGLGLSQLYGFVRQSDGVVRLDSAPGRGTVVRLYLPRHESMQQDGEAASQTAVPQDTGAGEAVLLVEDEADVRGPAAERLRELGYTVLEAANGPAALRLLRSGVRIDVLVTDVGLPGGLNGRQVADAVRERRPGVPVLFITGYAGSALENELAPGMEVIGKPFALDALAARVRAILELSPAA